MEKIAENDLKFKLTQRKNEDKRNMEREIHQKNLVSLNPKIKVH